MGVNGVGGIGRTRWRVPAGPGKNGRNKELVATHQPPNQFSSQVHNKKLSSPSCAVSVTPNNRLPGFRFRLIGVQPLQCRLKIGNKRAKRPRQRRRTTDHHKVITSPRPNWKHLVRRGFQTSARPIARHGVSHLAAYCESDPHERLVEPALLVGAVLPSLNDKPRRNPPSPRGCDPKKLRTPLQAENSGRHNGITPRDACVPWSADSR